MVVTAFFKLKMPVHCGKLLSRTGLEYCLSFNSAPPRAKGHPGPCITPSVTKKIKYLLSKKQPNPLQTFDYELSSLQWTEICPGWQNKSNPFSTWQGKAINLSRVGRREGEEPSLLEQEVSSFSFCICPSGCVGWRSFLQLCDVKLWKAMVLPSQDKSQRGV